MICGCCPNYSYASHCYVVCCHGDTIQQIAMLSVIHCTQCFAHFDIYWHYYIVLLWYSYAIRSKSVNSQHLNLLMQGRQLRHNT